MNRAFSLVELSIVLVILGLLTGGILAGKSLIRATELRSVSTEYSRYVTAAQAFRDKYFALPGDILNATSFWGDNNTLCPDAAIANGSPGTCNGNGNGSLEAGTAGSVQGEMFMYWQHLANAGLIEGSYSGIAGATNALHAVVDTNSPRSRIKSTAVWQVRDLGTRSGTDGMFDGDYGNTLLLAGQAAGMPAGPILSPEEAWNIDTKMDDGKAATGKIVGYITYLGCAQQASGAGMPGGVSSSSILTAVYNLSNSTEICMLMFRRVF